MAKDMIAKDMIELLPVLVGLLRDEHPNADSRSRLLVIVWSMLALLSLGLVTWGLVRWIVLRARRIRRMESAPVHTEMQDLWFLNPPNKPKNRGES